MIRANFLKTAGNIFIGFSFFCVLLYFIDIRIHWPFGGFWDNFEYFNWTKHIISEKRMFNLQEYRFGSTGGAFPMYSIFILFQTFNSVYILITGLDIYYSFIFLQIFYSIFSLSVVYMLARLFSPKTPLLITFLIFLSTIEFYFRANSFVFMLNLIAIYLAFARANNHGLIGFIYGCTIYFHHQSVLLILPFYLILFLIKRVSYRDIIITSILFFSFLCINRASILSFLITFKLINIDIYYQISSQSPYFFISLFFGILTVFLAAHAIYRRIAFYIPIQYGYIAILAYAILCYQFLGFLGSQRLYETILILLLPFMFSFLSTKYRNISLLLFAYISLLFIPKFSYLFGTQNLMSLQEINRIRDFSLPAENCIIGTKNSMFLLNGQDIRFCMPFDRHVRGAAIHPDNFFSYLENNHDYALIASSKEILGIEEKYNIRFNKIGDFPVGDGIFIYEKIRQ